MFPWLLIEMAKARQEELRRKAERERLSRVDRSRAPRGRTRLRVVIVGGGFGGLACARALDGAPADVILIDRENYHLFTPLLYQVATALLNPSDIAYPIRKVFRRSPNVRFRQATVTEVDFRAKVVRLHEGAEVACDRLVLATGSTNNYFGNPALADHTIGMKQLGEAMRLRNHVLSCLEMATQTTDPHERRAWLTFLVAGGGPTGVEYAGALGELLRLVVGRDFPEISLEECRIVLVEGMGRLLSQFPKSLGEYARRMLVRRGVDVLVSRILESAEGGVVRLSSGEKISCRTVVWSAGVRPTDPIEGATLRRTPTGRLRVDEHLRVPGVRGVFAIGDAASVRWRKGELPMLSPPAMQEGRHVARLIRDEAVGVSRGRRPFRYLDKGAMATIGRSSAVAQIGPLRRGGWPGSPSTSGTWWGSATDWRCSRRGRGTTCGRTGPSGSSPKATRTRWPTLSTQTLRCASAGHHLDEGHQKGWQRLPSLSIDTEVAVNQKAATDAAPGTPRPGENSILAAEGVTKRYGERTAITGVDLYVVRGEIVGLLGPNGAGKTTPVESSLDSADPTRGPSSSVVFAAWRHRREVRRMIGLAPTGTGDLPAGDRRREPAVLRRPRRTESPPGHPSNKRCPRPWALPHCWSAPPMPFPAGKNARSTRPRRWRTALVPLMEGSGVG